MDDGTDMEDRLLMMYGDEQVEEAPGKKSVRKSLATCEGKILITDAILNEQTCDAGYELTEADRTTLIDRLCILDSVKVRSATRTTVNQLCDMLMSQPDVEC